MRNSTWRRALWRTGAAILIAIVLQLASAHSAQARDARVWVNTNSGVYHCPDTRYYARLSAGGMRARRRRYQVEIARRMGRGVTKNLAHGDRRTD